MVVGYERSAAIVGVVRGVRGLWKTLGNETGTITFPMKPE